MIVNKASAHGLAVGHGALTHTCWPWARRSMAWVSTTWCGTAWVVHGMPHGATDDGVAAMPMGSELHAIVSKIMS